MAGKRDNIYITKDIFSDKDNFYNLNVNSVLYPNKEIDIYYHDGANPSVNDYFVYGDYLVFQIAWLIDNEDAGGIYYEIFVYDKNLVKLSTDEIHPGFDKYNSNSTYRYKTKESIIQKLEELKKEGKI